jgi:acetylornithine deacetylase/succinyl-diaminopimelate desuccinylase-like protein
MGDTIPVVGPFQRLLGAPAVLLGFAPPGARIHAPDENFPVATFFKAVATCERFLQEISQLPTNRHVTAGPRLARKVP